MANGGVGGDGGGDSLATAAAAAVCFGGDRLTEADCQRCLTEVTEVVEGVAAVTVCPLPLLLSAFVEAD